MHDNSSQLNRLSALFIGIDWADQKHDCFVIDGHGHGVHQQLEHSPEAIDAWINQLIQQADGRPIAIMLEQSRGALVHALMFRQNVLLYPVNPNPTGPIGLLGPIRPIARPDA